MKKIYCSLPERYVNPLFEVFDGGDFILSSYRDIEEKLTQVQIFFEDGPGLVEDAKRRLSDALGIVGVEAAIQVGEIPDEDWKLAYRRHFKTEEIGERLVVVPAWRAIVTLDPGMAFGTGKHETTRACLEFIEALASPSPSPSPSFLDMGCGSGILSIAAAKLGYTPVTGFDVDPEAIDASNENAALNGVDVTYFKYALGRVGGDVPAPRALPVCDLVAANILGPLLIRFADEIVPCVGKRLIISGILTELYEEVLAAYTSRGLRELERKTIGEWTTGLLSR